MKRRLGATAALLFGVLGISAQSNAMLIDHGGTTVQTGAALEWLDLSASAGYSINGVLGGAGGFVAAGWRFATISEVDALFYEAAGGIVPVDGVFTASPLVIHAAQVLNATLGALQSTVTFGDDPTKFIGSSSFAMSDDGTFATQLVFQVAEDASSARLWDTSYWAQWPPSIWNGSNGVLGHYLVRSASVPEPSALLLLMIGLAAFPLRRQLVRR